VKSKEFIVLAIILVVAAILRFANLGQTSLSNDELSSIVRAEYNSFSQLYKEGIKTDVHPAGLQVFLYYWIKIAGDSPFAVRFPFALCGVLSVLFTFLIARQWFNSNAGLFAAAAMAALQFPLLYSQVARMYSMGLFLCLVNIWCWNKIFIQPTDLRRKWLYYFLYALSALSAMYLHYFSLAFIGIIGLTGFVFVKRENITAYLSMWIVILLLFIPAIPLFLEQLKIGGLEDWLAKPGSNTFLKYLYYCFNESEILTCIFIGIPIASIVLVGRKTNLNKFQLVALAWFLIPYAIAYYYSIYRQPVLQYSGLLFSFPMLLLFLFSFIPAKQLKWNMASLPLLLVAATATSTAAEKDYFSSPHFGVFRQLAENTVAWEKKYGRQNITKVFTLISPKYVDYYFNRLNSPTPIDLNLVQEKKELSKLQSLLDTCKTPYLLYAWSNTRYYYETLELITQKYPLVAERDTFLNSEITLFKRSQTSNDNTIAFDTTGTFHEPQFENEKQKEFKVILYKQLNELNLSDNNMIVAEVQLNAPDSLQDVELVINFENFGENVGWNGIPLKYYYSSPGKPIHALLTSKIPDDRNSLLKVFIWNPKKRNLSIGDYKVTIKKRNPLYRTF
jgi:hypothetical protein